MLIFGVRAGEYRIKIPKGYMAKYIPPSEADRIVTGNGRVKGSCVVYDQIEKPALTWESLHGGCTDYSPV